MKMFNTELRWSVPQRDADEIFWKRGSPHQFLDAALTSENIPAVSATISFFSSSRKILVPFVFLFCSYCIHTFSTSSQLSLGPVES